MEPKSISCLKKGERNLINTNNPLIRMNQRLLAEQLPRYCSHTVKTGQLNATAIAYVKNSQKQEKLSEIDRIISDCIPSY